MEENSREITAPGQCPFKIDIRDESIVRQTSPTSFITYIT